MDNLRTTRIAQDLVRRAALQDRFDYLKKTYDTTERILQHLLRADPTGGSYLEWLVRRDVNPFNDLLLDTIRRLLLTFDDAKRRGILKKMGANADISHYNISGLTQVSEDILNQGLQTARQNQKKVKDTGARVVYDQPPMKIIQIGGPGVDPEKAIAAACIYARNTQWCTSNSPNAKQYLTKGPLCLVLRDNQKVAQYYPPSGSLKGITDHDLILWEDENQDIILALIQSGLDMPAVLISRLDEVGYPLTDHLKQKLQDERDFNDSLLSQR